MKHYTGKCHKCNKIKTGYILKKYSRMFICRECYKIDKDPNLKEARKREIIQKVQSRCKHRRRGIVSQEGHNVQYCQDCNKIFYDKEI